MNLGTSFVSAIPWQMLIVLVVCAVLSSVGFYKFVYFISVGYGLSIAGAGVTMLVIYWKVMPVECMLLCLLLILYGIRLGGFLLIREIKSPSYYKAVQDVRKEEQPMSIIIKASIWISVAILYTAQVSPVLYSLNNGLVNGLMPYIGAAIMTIAIVIEAVADKQKADVKKVDPNRFCDTGLYKIVRCPNYFGELLFWTGVFISGLGAYEVGLQWVIAISGYIMIVYIMFNGAKRLEIRQNKNYSSNQGYLEYANKTPILLPFVPLYHLEKVKFL